MSKVSDQKLQMKIGEKSMASILAASQPQLAENFKVYFKFISIWENLFTQ